MSQSGSAGMNGGQGQSQSGQTMDNQQTTCQNGRADPPAESVKQDLSNGFENRSMDFDRFAQDRSQHGQTTGQNQEQQQQPVQQSKPQQPQPQPQTQQQVGQYPTLRRQSIVGVPEDRHPPTGQLPPPQYTQEKSNLDRTQHVSQTSTQTVPVQAQPQFAPDYDQTQYSQIRSQFEVRPQIYPQQTQFDRAGYVTRDMTYRDPALYSQGATPNPVFTGQGQYVTVQHGNQIPSQSASPQPPYFSGVVVPQPPGYAQFGTQPQFSYSQYPQTVMNPVPYNPHAGIYPPQQFGQQSPNPQRFSQELGQYQTQPIIQPIAQNVAHGIAIATTERPSRGPKPMVPPRGNSKITHDTGHRKSASVDVTGIQKPKYEPGQHPPQEQVHRSDEAIIVPSSQIGPDGQERRYLTTINQNPRTRQDGLYVDTNGDQAGREKVVEQIPGDCGMYVARSEHRKSISVDVTTSFQRRNDTITFTFPGDANQEILIGGRKPGAVVETKRVEANQVYAPDQRRLETGLRVSPMAFDARQENRKSIGADRKPEWGNVSPNQRTVIPQENRRSDYFEEHRRSPMNIEGKRMDDVRRSPMPFVPIRETSADRAGQKSPSFVNQNFEKTRQELAIWAEQRQRQELERNMMQNPIFSTSPRSRNQSEERRDPRNMHQTEERKETRMTQSAFQPLPNISQSTIMEQRRHLRHVSADLTKHMELSRKEFDDQPISGSVANLGPTTVSAVSSQRASPNLCHQYPALSEAKIDTKTVLTVVTDFGDTNSAKPIEQVDHIIHSRRKSHNTSTNLLTHSKSQTDNLQGQLDAQTDKSDCIQVQQMQNQQSLDMISEKLCQFERQQSDLQAKLQCLQNQNQILDKVAQFQHQQSDLQARLQCLQTQNQLTDKAQRSTDFAQLSIANEIHQVQGTPPLSNHQEQSSDKSSTSQSQHSAHGHRQALLTASYPPNSNHQPCQSSVCEKLSPRLQHDTADPNSIQIPNMSQMPLPCLPQFDRTDASRGSFSQFHRLQCQIDGHEGAAVPTAATVPTTSFTGTLKKVPPEKPPRTSLIVQSPEVESNRSQPAIGLKQTPKARTLGNVSTAGFLPYTRTANYRLARRETRNVSPSDIECPRRTGHRIMDDHEIQSTVESILGPGVKVVDCEKKSCVREEEVLLINGVPIPLEGPDGVAIREAMITGQVPPCDLLNQILVKAGILRAPVRLETSLSVKSSIVTKEEVTVARGGKVVDERSRETKENNYYASSTSEIWEPVGILHRPRNIKPFDSSDESRPNSNASSDQGYTTNTSSNHAIRMPAGPSAAGCPICEDNDPDCARRCLGGLAGLGGKPPVQATGSPPTIFGTVASDLNPKEGNSRRSLPQTPAGGVGGKGNAGGSGGPGMVNGAGADHQDGRDGAAINTEHALVYRDGNLVSGSLEALVQHMVPTEEYYPDRAYLFAFLLSARLFIKPHELLGEVCALCEHQQNLNGEGGKERLQRFVPRLVQLLAEWTETFPYDFRDERVMGHVSSITQKVAAVDAAARQEVSALLQNLLLRLTALERYEEGLARLATEAATEQLTQVDITELCPSATVLAQQLTHVELERLSYIGPEEFVQAFAKESPHLETSFKDMKKTRNLESYVQWFNRLSYFVATEVCKHAKKKQRVRVVEYWIETARECFNIGNFNSLMAIIAGLNMSPISRLKKTWSKVQSAKFSILEHQMDPSSNFSSYRSTLKAAMWRSAGATDERQRIVVPFFSLLVKDLYFLNEGCSNKLPNGHINFEKFWQLAKQVTEFIAWKQVACPFERNPRVLAFLQASPVLTENALALASFECEPPDNNPERERYKALKSELNAQ